MSLQTIGPYTVGKTLGTGSYSKVKLATNKLTGQKMAIKIVSKKQLLAKPKNLERIRREISVQKLIKHPSVIHIFDVYETKKHLFLVLEYLPKGELFDYIVERGRVPSDEARVFFRQIISAIEHIHSFSITHRDLKPENLLLSQNNTIKIADFGMAKIMETGDLLQTACGSPHYISPEVLKGKGYDGKKSDIWACGVILYALLCGYLPFDEKKYQKLLYKIKKGKYTFPPYLDDMEMDLISKLLNVDPVERIGIKEIKKHPFFTAELPKNYILPSPLVNYEDIAKKPISPSKVDHDIVEEIEQLGWIQNTEILERLQSKDSNIVKIFYTSFKKYNSQNQGDGKEEKSENNSKKKKLPSRRRRNSLNRTRKISVTSTNNNKNKKSPQKENNSGVTKNDKEIILQLQKLVEKTEKQNDLDATDYSEIISEVNSFESDSDFSKEDYLKQMKKSKKSKKTQKKEKKLTKTKKSKKPKKSKKSKKTNELNESNVQNRFSGLKSKSNKRFNKTRSKSLRSNPISRLSWDNRNGIGYKGNDDDDDDDDDKKNSNPINVNNQKSKSKKIKKKKKKNEVKSNDSKKAKKGNKLSNLNVKDFSPNKNKKKKKKKVEGTSLSLNLNNSNHDNHVKKKDLKMKKEKNTKKNPKFGGLSISVNNNHKREGDNGKSNKDSKNGKTNTNQFNEEELNMMGLDQDNVDKNTEQSKKKFTGISSRTPRFHRRNKKNSFFQIPQTPTQEEFGFGSKRWFDETVSKKEQRKLNNELKKKLKKVKKDLMKTLHQNENLPVFVCNNRIIAVSSGEFLPVITELQTALTICNYNWNHPNFWTLKGENGKFSIKIKIMQNDLNSIIENVSDNMIDKKKIKKKKNTSIMDEKEKIQKKVLQQLDVLKQTQDRNFKLSIEFIWKTGSAKKFIEETENIVHFLSE
ncbi:protein kinase [Anaeramoeba flamelloides]|uniref:Protein kinase n=1 Tax=Anaeramoeba flamelloides TaxID=1746091 RepID=A0ABQ8Y417_9EUKA|nr:protein kinase [Anaeramoeba flamelloides]